MFTLRLLSILLLLVVQTVLALKKTTDYQMTPPLRQTVTIKTLQDHTFKSQTAFEHSAKTTRSTRRPTVGPLHSNSSSSSSSRSVSSRLIFLAVGAPILVVIVIAGVIAAWCFCNPFQSKEKTHRSKENASPTSSHKGSKKLKGCHGASSIAHKLSHKKHPKMSHMVSSAQQTKLGKGATISATAKTNRIGNLNRQPVSKFIGSTGRSLSSSHGPPSKMDPRFGTMSSTILIDVDCATPANSALDVPSADGSQLSELSNHCSSGPPKHALGTSIERLSDQTDKKNHKQPHNHKRH